MTGGSDSDTGAHAEHRPVPVAVVGIAALMPGARDAAEFWRNILTGRDLITDVPPGHWPADGFYDPDPATPDTTYSRRGAFLPEIDFDPLAHGLPPAALPAVDPAQLLGLVVADELLADLDRNLGRPLDRERVSVILGSSTLSRVGTMDARIQRPLWLKALREQGIPEGQAQAICERIAEQYVPWQEATFPGLLSNVVAGRIANRLDLHGTNCTVDAACASSLAAVAAAVNELSLGKADLVVTGGVDATNNPLMYVCFSKTPALSPSGDVRPFSDDADGTMLGEGLAMLGLKRLDAAERDGDRVYAVIRGLGTSSDGRGGAIYAPVPEGQIRALRRAYGAAGYGPDTVELVEAHGTATRAGDAAEFEALRRVFAESGPADGQWCALGTVKSQIGHTKAAAGAAGLIKAVLSLHHRVLPPTIKVRRPNPALGVEDSPFYLNTAARPWTRGAEHERRASVSSFGFGGANYHVAMSEHRSGGSVSPERAAPRFRVAASELVLFSAPSASELCAQMRTGNGARGGALALADLARAAQQEFDPRHPARLAVVARNADDLRAELDRAVAVVERQPDAPFALPGGVLYGCGDADPGGIAFVFPGQGSQYVGMGADIAMAFPAAQEVWDLAAGLDLGARGLHEVVFPPPVFSDEQRAEQDRRLIDTRWAQPALAAHSMSLLGLLGAIGIEPECVAGHSLGELVALHAAGAMDAASLLLLARQRGELLAQIDAEPGGMLAIGADPETVTSAIGAGGLVDVWIANINAPRQTVVSGAVRAIDVLEKQLSTAGVASRRLAVSAAFHSPLARSAVAPLRKFLDGLDLAPPRLDVYGNADASAYARDPEAIRDRLAEHPAAPVRFRDQIEAMYAAGIRTFVEVGAGSALTGLIGQILADRSHLAVPLDKRGRDGVTAWHEALGRLAVRGVPMDLPRLSGHWVFASPTPASRAKAPKMSVRIDGTGYAPPRPSLPPSKPRAAAQPPPPVSLEPVLAMPEPEPRDMMPPAPTLAAPAAVTVPAAPVAPSTHAAVPSADWLAAVQEVQRQTAEAHMHFQRVLSEAHQAFLQMAENTFAAFAAPQAAATGVNGVPVQAKIVEIPLPPAPQPFVEVPTAPAPPPAPPPIPDSVITPVTTVAVAPQVETEPVSLALLLAIVADKTGYPVDMLDGGMDLETDLGIDSIKKVEILAAVRQRAHGLPPTDSPQMARLFQARTLEEILRRAAEPDEPAAMTPAEGGPTAPTVAVRRLQVMPSAAAACGLAMAGLRSGPITVIDGGSGLASAVVAELAAQGIGAACADAPSVDAWGVILLGGLAPVSDPEQAAAVSRAAFQAARTVAAGMEKRGGVFVTVQDTGGCFGLMDPDSERAWLGGLAALARTAAREWPLVAVKAVDCQRADRDDQTVAAAIVSELLTGGATLDVGLRADGTRWTVTEAETETEAKKAPGLAEEHPVNADSVVVATGGARGVTAAALRSLAAAYRPRILLIGRTELVDEPADLSGARDEPSLARVLGQRERHSTPAQLAARARTILAQREIRETLADLERSGATARYAAFDVGDGAALHRELDRVRSEWGPVTAVVHGAGVLADKRITDKTDDQFDHVYAAKVDGLRTLLEATAADPLNVLCLFSSVAARYGNPGQCDYAMANETLNQVASAVQLVRPSCLVRSIGWGPWDAGMVTASLAAHFMRLGVPLIALEAGARAFVEEIGAAHDAVQVLITAATDASSRDDKDDKADDVLSCVHPRLLGELKIDAQSHGYLEDHAPAGVPVLPLALALEWFAAAGRSRFADRPTVLREVRVLSRVELPDLDAMGHRLTVERDESDHSPGALALRLTSPAGIAHYQALLVAPNSTPPFWSAPTIPPEVLILTDKSIYKNPALFHGPRFQTLRRVEGLSREGAEAQVVGLRSMDWPGRIWWTDPAAIDGALQTAVLWARHATGDATLPMGVDECRVHRTGPAPGIMRCSVRAVDIAPDLTRCDIALFDQDGEMRTELLGVSLIRRPDMDSVTPEFTVS